MESAKIGQSGGTDETDSNTKGQSHGIEETDAKTIVSTTSVQMKQAIDHHMESVHSSLLFLHTLNIIMSTKFSNFSVCVHVPKSVNDIFN